MNADGKSHEPIVPSTRANNAGTEPAAESVEGRPPTAVSFRQCRSAKRNVDTSDSGRTQTRTKRGSIGLDGVRGAARNNPGLKFVNLLHHVNEDRLTKAFLALKKDAATGVDDVTWRDYEQGLAARITDLCGRIHRGAYRAKPSKRIFTLTTTTQGTDASGTPQDGICCRNGARKGLAKPDGRQRPIGIAALEDKIVQKAVGQVLECIYEEDFLGFSYGFRPRKSQHNALDALSVALTSKPVNWVLDAEVAGFFDEIDHEWLMKCFHNGPGYVQSQPGVRRGGLPGRVINKAREGLEHRIADKRILRLIRQCCVLKRGLRAGVSEDGEWSRTTVGTPQGAVISPLLANVYLHYVLDLWIQWWRTQCRGEVVVIRFADDRRGRIVAPREPAGQRPTQSDCLAEMNRPRRVIGFERKDEADRCLSELRERFAKFGLRLHDTKTRLIEFGRHAAGRRKARGEGRPETFDFLGFTHRCGMRFDRVTSIDCYPPRKHKLLSDRTRVYSFSVAGCSRTCTPLKFVVASTSAIRWARGSKAVPRIFTLMASTFSEPGRCP